MFGRANRTLVELAIKGDEVVPIPGIASTKAGYLATHQVSGNILWIEEAVSQIIGATSNMRYREWGVEDNPQASHVRLQFNPHGASLGILPRRDNWFVRVGGCGLRGKNDKD